MLIDDFLNILSISKSYLVHPDMGHLKLLELLVIYCPDGRGEDIHYFKDFGQLEYLKAAI